MPGPRAACKLCRGRLDRAARPARPSYTPSGPSATFSFSGEIPGASAPWLPIGVTLEGTRDCLGLWIEKTEGARFWTSLALLSGAV